MRTAQGFRVGLRHRLLASLVLVTAVAACEEESAAPAKPREWIDDISQAPDAVFFRTNLRTFNSRHYALVCGHDIYFKPNTERTGEQGPWEKLENLPPALAGDVIEIALDDTFLMALSSERRLYQMRGASEGREAFVWYEYNGMPFGLGVPNILPQGIAKWDWSVVSPQEDGNYTDHVGNQLPVGSANCAHLTVLKEGGRWISINDAWLPADLNYEICSPKRGTFSSVNLSASGSTFFLMSRYGDMFTTIWDWDSSGPNVMMRSYSYYDQTGLENPAHQLPAAPWTMHPKIDGRITNIISLHKIGMNCVHRTMRVEGVDATGATGYYEKDITELAGNPWVFHVTNAPLVGDLIDNRSGDTSDLELSAPEDYYFSRNLASVPALAVEPPAVITREDWAGELLDFNCYCSPATLRIHLSAGVAIDLVFHTTETVRYGEVAGRGLASGPRPENGTIEVPLALLESLDTLDPKARLFIEQYLNAEQFTPLSSVVVSLAAVEMKGSGIDWRFESGSAAP